MGWFLLVLVKPVADIRNAVEHGGVPHFGIDLAGADFSGASQIANLSIGEPRELVRHFEPPPRRI